MKFREVIKLKKKTADMAHDSIFRTWLHFIYDLLLCAWLYIYFKFHLILVDRIKIKIWI